MNDRYKYRIFYDNKIVYPNSWDDIESIYECLKQQITWDCKIDTDIKFDHIANNLIFMQSTGLKDKNGKLIYEGDIIKVGNGSINGSVIETTREVKWIINTWNVPVWVVDKPNFSHYVQVIGNVYENKDLLNDRD